MAIFFCLPFLSFSSPSCIAPPNFFKAPCPPPASGLGVLPGMMHIYTASTSNREIPLPFSLGFGNQSIPPLPVPPRKMEPFGLIFFLPCFFCSNSFRSPFPPTAGDPSSIFHRNTCLQRQIFSPLTIPLSCCHSRVWGVERGGN